MTDRALQPSNSGGRFREYVHRDVAGIDKSAGSIQKAVGVLGYAAYVVVINDADLVSIIIVGIRRYPGINLRRLGTMTLTDATVKNAAAGERPYRVADAGGLYLYVAPSGLKSFCMTFTLDGQEQLLTFGPYPDMKLFEARDWRDAVRTQLLDGVDPADIRKRVNEKLATAPACDAQLLTFEQGARKWWEMQSKRWSKVHATDVIIRLEHDVFPSLGERPMISIRTSDVLDTLRAVEERGSVETARRLRQRIVAIYDLFVCDGVVDINPAAGIVNASRPPKKGVSGV